jgi:DNA processing protein
MIGVGPRGPRRAIPDEGADRPEGVPPLHVERVTRSRPSWHDLDLAAMPADDRPAWVALSLVPGMGPVGFAAVLARYGSARTALRAGEALLPLIRRAGPDTAPALRRAQREPPEQAMADVERAVTRVGGQTITALDEAYPGPLTQLDPRPPVLYVAGSLDALHGPSVAIVGTRRASGYGRSVAIDIGDALARAGLVVISGLAIGIDGEAHRAAVEAGGRSVAVLPSPLDRVYPARHAELAERLRRTGGALVSEVPPGRAIGRPDFARRNRLIAGLAQSVVVVEAPDRSGALLTASMALEIGRELYAVPGPIDAVASRGCNRLIADHDATIVTSAGSLLQRLGARVQEGRHTVGALSDAEGLVLGSLLRRSASIEELLGATRLPVGAIASSLTLLEARGLATSYGGSTFHATLTARGRGTVRNRGARA